jgi:hypothetical protein
LLCFTGIDLLIKLDKKYIYWTKISENISNLVEKNNINNRTVYSKTQRTKRFNDLVIVEHYNFRKQQTTTIAM